MKRQLQEQKNNMPKVRIKNYEPGDKIVLYIPENVNPNTLKYINTLKFASPAIMELIEQQANKVYSENNHNLTKR